MPDPQNLRRWDVICRVVDHYGDAGVCLRLARGLAAAPGREVRLLVDRPAVVLDLIQPRPEPESLDLDEPISGAANHAPTAAPTAGHDSGPTWLDRSGVQICGWDAPARAVDVVLETFSCDLPARLLADMRARKASGHKVPVWLNLDHLSAEDWVEGCHGLPSPQSGGLTRWFLYPGFTADTAGLPGPPARLPELPDELAALLCGLAAPAAASRTDGQRGISQTDANQHLTASVFCYRESPLPTLLDAIQRGPCDVRLAIPAGMPGELGGRVLGDAPGSTWQGEGLTLVRIPFVDQDLYDSVLAACDFNIVRGEDSFVRAQWAARPLLWAAYRQAEDAHQAKVEAWLARCAMPTAWAALTRWFNGADTGVPVDALWRDAVAGSGAANSWGGPAGGGARPQSAPRSAAEIPHAAAKANDWRNALLALPRVETALAEFASHHAS